MLQLNIYVITFSEIAMLINGEESSSAHQSINLSETFSITLQSLLNHFPKLGLNVTLYNMSLNYIQLYPICIKFDAISIHFDSVN